jgi:hypothetical protein
MVAHRRAIRLADHPADRAFGVGPTRGVAVAFHSLSLCLLRWHPANRCQVNIGGR